MFSKISLHDRNGIDWHFWNNRVVCSVRRWLIRSRWTLAQSYIFFRWAGGQRRVVPPFSLSLSFAHIWAKTSSGSAIVWASLKLCEMFTWSWCVYHDHTSKVNEQQFKLTTNHSNRYTQHLKTMYFLDAYFELFKILKKWQLKEGLFTRASMTIILEAQLVNSHWIMWKMSNAKKANKFSPVLSNLL